MARAIEKRPCLKKIASGRHFFSNDCLGSEAAVSRDESSGSLTLGFLTPVRALVLWASLGQQLSTWG